jgi:transporter family-2 protein
MALFLVLIALTVGVVLPAQAGINAQLRVWLGHPIQAALVSFAVGTLVLFAASLALRLSWPSVEHISGAPPWVWVGGIFGATYVSMAVVLAPRLGAATLIGASVAGQLVGSLLMDHYGAVGYAVRPLSPERIVGAGLLLVGVFLIHKF